MGFHLMVQHGASVFPVRGDIVAICQHLSSAVLRHNISTLSKLTKACSDEQLAVHVVAVEVASAVAATVEAAGAWGGAVTVFGRALVGILRLWQQSLEPWEVASAATFAVAFVCTVRVLMRVVRGVRRVAHVCVDTSRWGLEVASRFLVSPRATARAAMTAVSATPAACAAAVIFGVNVVSPNTLSDWRLLQALALHRAGRSAASLRRHHKANHVGAFEHLVFWIAAAPLCVAWRASGPLLFGRATSWRMSARKFATAFLLWLSLPCGVEFHLLEAIAPRVLQLTDAAVDWCGSHALGGTVWTAAGALHAVLGDGVAFVLAPAVFFLPGLTARFGATVLGLVMPAWGSASSLKLRRTDGGPSELEAAMARVHFWLKYWCVHTVYVVLLRPQLSPVLQVVPMSHLAEAAALLWLQLPLTRGAARIFDEAERRTNFPLLGTVVGD